MHCNLSNNSNNIKLDKMANKIELSVTRESILSQKTSTKKFMVFPDDVFKYNKGLHVQLAFPYLSANDREFIISGINENEWKETFGESEEE